jgi:hypothetical protein
MPNVRAALPGVKKNRTPITVSSIPPANASQISQRAVRSVCCPAMCPVP